MTDAIKHGRYEELKRDISRLGEFPIIRYLMWSRYTKGAYKKMWKGLLKSLKGIAYILIFLYSVKEITRLPLGMGLLVLIIGSRGVLNLARGIYLSLRARSMAGKSRGERVERRWKYYMLWTHSTVLIAIMSLSFLLIIEQIKAPQVIRGDKPWYIWPFVYLGIWVIWSLVTRSMVLGGARAFKVGDRLAKVQHDRKMLNKVPGEGKGRRILLATVYVPLIGLAVMLFLVILLKVLLRFLLKTIFDIEQATSIGEEIARLVLGTGFSLSDISSLLGTWYGPLLLYLVVIVLICFFAYLRSFAMIRAAYRDGFHSHLGKRIMLAEEMGKLWK
ncbi:MAG: hypothetical protein JW939_01450 [Candidatus Thermoplasmatota archaeon]|nr:hypothetical protein [Candidatus Thermoplasmatota archaeon]